MAKRPYRRLSTPLTWPFPSDSIFFFLLRRGSAPAHRMLWKWHHVFHAFFYLFQKEFPMFVIEKHIWHVFHFRFKLFYASILYQNRDAVLGFSHPLQPELRVCVLGLVSDSFHTITIQRAPISNKDDFQFGV